MKYVIGITLVAAMFALTGCAGTPPPNQPQVNGHATIKYFPVTGQPTYHKPY